MPLTSESLAGKEDEKIPTKHRVARVNPELSLQVHHREGWKRLLGRGHGGGTSKMGRETFNSERY